MTITQEQLDAHAEWTKDPSKGSRIKILSANLSGANLSGANLIGSNLLGANLSHANLSDANLSHADLRGANLSDANLSHADLRGANLSDANLNRANLRLANLRYANLSGANLIGANLPSVSPIKGLYRKLADAIGAGKASIDMSEWHQCKTVHCLAGWIVTLAGEDGSLLEKEIKTSAAAALIHAVSEPSMRIPDWYESDSDAVLSRIRKLAEGARN